jgi:sporulation protein YlmC with PRC-barrel domain
MLITHIKPTELWGKKVYDTNGRCLGEVVAIASRRGVVRKVVVQQIPSERRVGLLTPADMRVDANIVTLPAKVRAVRPQLRLVQ